MSEDLWWIWTAILLGNGVVLFALHEYAGLKRWPIPWKRDERFEAYSTVVIRKVKEHGWRLAAPLGVFLLIAALTFLWLILHFILEPMDVIQVPGL